MANHWTFDSVSIIYIRPTNLEYAVKLSLCVEFWKKLDQKSIIYSLPCISTENYFLKINVLELLTPGFKFKSQKYCPLGPNFYNQNSRSFIFNVTQSRFFLWPNIKFKTSDQGQINFIHPTTILDDKDRNFMCELKKLPWQEEILKSLSMSFLSIKLSSTARTWNCRSAADIPIFSENLISQQNRGRKLSSLNEEKPTKQRSKKNLFPNIIFQAGFWSYKPSNRKDQWNNRKWNIYIYIKKRRIWITKKITNLEHGVALLLLYWWWFLEIWGYYYFILFCMYKKLEYFFPGQFYISSIL